MPLRDHLGEAIAVEDLTPGQCLDVLRSTECWCGKWKRKLASHCTDCYRWLPRPMQQSLFKTVEHGYVEAYKASLEYLAT